MEAKEGLAIDGIIGFRAGGVQSETDTSTLEMGTETSLDSGFRGHGKPGKTL